MNTPLPMPEAQVFRHEAMHTTFEYRLLGDLADSARSIARECDERLDLLESRLSRFLDGSDVSRINTLKAGETLYLSEDCHRCLRQALEAHALTGGLFDATIGTRIAHRKDGLPGLPPPLIGQLTLHPDVPAVTCIQPGRQIDLGAIGKGFALDELHQLLTDRDCPAALLASGASTILAFGDIPWPVELTGDKGTLRIPLAGMALGSSGRAFQGDHIVDPRDEEAPTPPVWKRVWVAAPTAAQADAWSTAVMLMDRCELTEFLGFDETARAIWVEHDDGIECMRPLPTP